MTSQLSYHLAKTEIDTRLREARRRQAAKLVPARHRLPRVRRLG